MVEYEDDTDGTWDWWAATITKVNKGKDVHTYALKYDDGTREGNVHPDFIMTQREYKRKGAKGEEGGRRRETASSLRWF